MCTATTCRTRLRPIQTPASRFAWRSVPAATARFDQSNRAVATGFTANDAKRLDTSYSVQEVGGARRLQFAAMPDGYERDVAFQRLFAQRNGALWYAYKDSLPGMPYHRIRLNGAATGAMAKALGVD